MCARFLNKSRRRELPPSFVSRCDALVIGVPQVLAVVGALGVVGQAI